jgi:phosphoribosylformylglycinamidine synthase
MVAMGGELGMDIDLRQIPSHQGLPDSRLLYSESSGRFIATVSPENTTRFEELFAGLKWSRIGVVASSSRLRVTGTRGKSIIDEEIADLKACWKEPFGDLI